jgi:hypothetical protein
VANKRNSFELTQISGLESQSTLPQVMLLVNQQGRDPDAVTIGVSEFESFKSVYCRLFLSPIVLLSFSSNIV